MDVGSPALRGLPSGTPSGVCGEYGPWLTGWRCIPHSHTRSLRVARSPEEGSSAPRLVGSTPTAVTNEHQVGSSLPGVRFPRAANRSPFVEPPGSSGQVAHTSTAIVEPPGSMAIVSLARVTKVPPNAPPRSCSWVGGWAVCWCWSAALVGLVRVWSGPRCRLVWLFWARPSVSREVLPLRPAS